MLNSNILAVMSETNVNFNPRVILDRLRDNIIDALVKHQQIEINSEILLPNDSALEEKNTLMADKDQLCDPSQEQRPDESNDSKTKLDQNESDVTLINLEVGEMMQISDERETTTTSSSNRNNTNVVLVLINFSGSNQTSVSQSTIEKTDSKESLAATVSNDSAYLSQSTENNESASSKRTNRKKGNKSWETTSTEPIVISSDSGESDTETVHDSKITETFPKKDFIEDCSPYSCLEDFSNRTEMTPECLVNLELPTNADEPQIHSSHSGIPSESNSLLIEDEQGQRLIENQNGPTCDVNELLTEINTSLEFDLQNDGNETVNRNNTSEIVQPQNDCVVVSSNATIVYSTGSTLLTRCINDSYISNEKTISDDSGDSDHSSVLIIDETCERNSISSDEFVPNLSNENISGINDTENHKSLNRSNDKITFEEFNVKEIFKSDKQLLTKRSASDGDLATKWKYYYTIDQPTGQCSSKTLISPTLDMCELLVSGERIGEPCENRVILSMEDVHELPISEDPKGKSSVEGVLKVIELSGSKERINKSLEERVLEFTDFVETNMESSNKRVISPMQEIELRDPEEQNVESSTKTTISPVQAILERSDSKESSIKTTISPTLKVLKLQDLQEPNKNRTIAEMKEILELPVLEEANGESCTKQVISPMQEIPELPGLEEKGISKNEEEPKSTLPTKLTTTDDVLTAAQLECGLNENNYDSSCVNATESDQYYCNLRSKVKRRSTIGNESPLNPKKRMKMCTSTETESDIDRNVVKMKTHKAQDGDSTKSFVRKKTKPSQKIVGKVGRFFTKMSTNWREQRKKLKSKLFRKKRTQNTSAGVFTVTNINEKMFESVSGFKVIPTYQDFKDNLIDNL